MEPGFSTTPIKSLENKKPETNMYGAIAQKI